jgi:hypothetical protein
MNTPQAKLPLAQAKPLSTQAKPLSAQAKLISSQRKANQYQPYGAVDSGSTSTRSSAATSIPHSMVITTSHAARLGLYLDAWQRGAVIQSLWRDASQAPDQQYQVEFVCHRGKVHRQSVVKAYEGRWAQRQVPKGESICVAILMSLFPSSHFEREYHADWLRVAVDQGAGDRLITNTNVGRLRLDLYSDDLQLALEHHGRQHYEVVGIRGDSPEQLALRQQLDGLKAQACVDQGVQLMVIDQRQVASLNIEQYLAVVVLQLQALGLEPECQLSTGELIAQVRGLVERWIDQPFLHLQQQIAKRLAQTGHTLMNPPLDQLWAGRVFEYTCGSCGAVNVVEARGFADTPTKGNCPCCKHSAIGISRRAPSLQYLANHLSAEQLAQISHDPQGKLLLTCAKGHVTPFNRYEDCVQRFNTQATHQVGSQLGSEVNGQAVCGQCLAAHYSTADLTVSVEAAWVLQQSQVALLAGVRQAGFTIDSVDSNDIAYQTIWCPITERLTLEATVQCAHGHTNRFTLRSLRQMAQNQTLQQLAEGTAWCMTCLYDQDQPVLRGVSIAHRLKLLQQIHPQAVYVSDFDSAGTQQERYRCGQSFADGQPHPAFSVSGRELAKRFARHTDPSPLCYCCNAKQQLQADWARHQQVNTAKAIKAVDAITAADGSPQTDQAQPPVKLPYTRYRTLAHIQGRMQVIADHFSQISGQVMPTPVVTDADGNIDPEMLITTSKTKLRFHCGDPSHAAVIKTADSYFNKARGVGYCRQCVMAATSSSSSPSHLD